MMFRLKNILSAAVILLGSTSGALYAQNPTLQCPTLSANDVENVIANGTILTKQDYSLAEEAGKSRPQVLIDEPTANPFDTYYQMFDSKMDNGQLYFIYIGNILGKAAFEAKARARTILLGNEKSFEGKPDPSNEYCMYKEVHASPSVPNYPFKSTFESVVLVSIPLLNSSNFMNQMMMKKHRRS